MTSPLPAPTPNLSAPSIYFIYSPTDEKCSQILSNITPYHKQYIKFIYAQCPIMQQAILNASTIKVEYIPCILQVFPDGTVAKYENDDAMNWFGDFFEKTKMQQIKQLQNQTQNQNSSKQQNQTRSSIDNILRNDPIEQGEFEASRRSSRLYVSDNNRDQMEPNTIRGDGHTKMRRSSIMNITDDIPETDDEGDNYDDGLDDSVANIEDQVDMENPIANSLSRQAIKPKDTNTNKKASTVTITGKNKKVTVIQDLTPHDEIDDLSDNYDTSNVDDDPSGMNTVAVNASTNVTNVAKKEKTNQLLKLVEQMKNSREQEDDKIQNPKILATKDSKKMMRSKVSL